MLIYYHAMRLIRYIATKINSVFFLTLFICLVSVFLLHYAITGKAVYGDGIGYYAHLHDWVFDNDWNYTNEYKHIYSSENNNAVLPQSVDDVQIVAVTAGGKAANHFFPGTAVLLLPFYWLADVVTRVLISFGASMARNGYSDIYQLVTGIGSIFYVVAGVFFLEKLVVFYFKSTITAKASVVTILLASPLLYYGSYDVINSHPISFFLSSIFFYVLLTKNNFSVALLAVIAGTAVMTRVQDIFLVAIFIIQTLVEVVKKQNFFVTVVKKLLLFFVVFLVTLLPLYLYWSETFGSFAQHTYIQAFIKERAGNINTNWLGSFFDIHNGLFIKTPLLLVLFGWYCFSSWKEKKFLYWQLALFFLFQCVIISLQGGWKAAAYGGRMYISSLPFFAVILGSLFSHTSKKQLVKIFFIVLFGIAINLGSIINFVLFAKEAEQGNRGIEVRTKERIKLLFSSN